MPQIPTTRSQRSPGICFRSDSANQTRRLAQKVGADLDSGAVLALTGDLGSGKTCFVQGLAAGLQVPEHCPVTSPTFTLVNEYPGHRPLYHVDLYRVEAPWDAEDLGLDEVLDGDGITAIEWAERLPGILPEDFVEIHFEILGDEQRNITFFGIGNAAGWIEKHAGGWTLETPAP